MQKTDIAPFHIIGITVRTTNENQQAMTDIEALWHKFMSEGILEKIPNKVNNAVYSLYTEYESDHTKPYTTVLGCQVKNLDEIPSEMRGFSFDGGPYVKLSASGDVTKGLVGNKWYEIWQMDLDRKYTADFEYYGENENDPNNIHVDFFIAVK